MATAYCSACDSAPSPRRREVCRESHQPNQRVGTHDLFTSQQQRV